MLDDIVKKEHLVIVASLAIWVLIFGFESGCWGHGMGGRMGSLSMAGFSWVLLALVLLLIYYLLKDKKEETPDAFEILKRRHAKGEITIDEYIKVWTALTTQKD